MHPPKIFISATSGDLGSVRQIVKEALLTINCHPVEQTNFEPDARTVENMLRGKIGDCQALIHICGMRYGAEPDVTTLPSGCQRRSYTQMEYHLARQLQEQRGDDHFRVYTFICPEEFPYDPEPDVEAAEKRDLQRTHRSRLYDDPHLREKPKTSDDLRLRILALQEQVLALKQEQSAVKTEVIRNRHLGLKAFAVLLILVVGIFWGIHRLKTQNIEVSNAVAKVQTDVSEVKMVFAKERKFMSLILARANERIKDWEKMTPGQRFEFALDEIAAEQKIPAKELRDLLDLYVQRVEVDPDAQAEDKFFVLMRKQAFGEAAELANREGQSAVARMKQQSSRREAAQAIASKAAQEEDRERQRAIDFYQKKGSAYLSAALYDRALQAYQEAADLVDKVEDPVEWAEAQLKVTYTLVHLARHKAAEPLLREIVLLREQHLGNNNPETATAINDLAQCLRNTNRHREAESLMRRVLQIDEIQFGADHPKVARDLNNLADLLFATNRHTEAEVLLLRVLKIYVARYGPEHHEVAHTLNNLAEMFRSTNRLVEAERMFRQALKINETSLGRDDPQVAFNLNNLSLLLMETNRHAEAEPLMRRAIKIFSTSYGTNHPMVALSLNNLAQLLMNLKRFAEAEQLMLQALKINEASYGPDDPNVALCLNNLAQFLNTTNRTAEAESMYRRAMKINEASYGPDHPDVAINLNNLALLAQVEDRASEAEAMFRRALKINEESYGQDHPKVALNLSNLAQLLQSKNRPLEAEPLIRRAVAIFIKFQVRTGHRHRDGAIAIEHYVLLVRGIGGNEAESNARLDKLRREVGLEEAAFELIWQEALAAIPAGPFQVVIVFVVKGGQAEALGLQAGDVYLRYNNEVITSMQQIILLTSEAKGEAIPLEVLREGRTLTFSVKPGKLGAMIENRPK